MRHCRRAPREHSHACRLAGLGVFLRRVPPAGSRLIHGLGDNSERTADRRGSPAPQAWFRRSARRRHSSTGALPQQCRNSLGLAGPAVGNQPSRSLAPAARASFGRRRKFPIACFRFRCPAITGLKTPDARTAPAPPAATSLAPGTQLRPASRLARNASPSPPSPAHSPAPQHQFRYRPACRQAGAQASSLWSPSAAPSSCTRPPSIGSFADDKGYNLTGLSQSARMPMREAARAGT